MSVVWHRVDVRTLEGTNIESLARCVDNFHSLNMEISCQELNCKCRWACLRNLHSSWKFNANEQRI
jgi:hypothetical protein